MKKLLISPLAEEDLAEIKNYISVELNNPSAALKIMKQIMKRIRQLIEVPEIGAPLSSVVDIETDYRFLVCGKYLVFYRIEDENVFVSRVFYGKRDYLKLLFSGFFNND